MTDRADAAALGLTLDRTSPVPLYHQLVEQLTLAIEGGALKPGELIEREDLLAARLDISRPTLRRALGELAELGLLVRTRGVGTIVKAGTAPVTSSSAGGRCPTGGHRPADRRARTQLLRLELDRIDADVARELGLPEHSPLIYLEELLILNGRSAGIRRTWLSSEVVNPLPDLVMAPPRRILSEAGHPVASERRTLGFRAPDATEQAILGVRDPDPVFTVVGLAFDVSGAPVERTATSYRSESDQYDTLLAAS